MFDDPANQFVADFVGEPKINLFEGVMEDRSSDDGVIVKVGSAGSLRTAARAGGARPVVVGLRPQDCVVERGERDATNGMRAFEGSVRVFEHLLEFGLATVDVEGLDESFVVQTAEDVVYDRDDRITLSADPERVYLFNPESGERIR